MTQNPTLFAFRATPELYSDIVQPARTHTACTRGADDSVDTATVQIHNTDAITAAAFQEAVEPLCRWNRAATVRTMLFGTTTRVSTARPVMGEVLLCRNHFWMLLRS